MDDKLKDITPVLFKDIRDRCYRVEPLNSAYPEFAVGTIQQVTYNLGLDNGKRLGRDEVISEIDTCITEAFKTAKDGADIIRAVNLELTQLKEQA